MERPLVVTDPSESAPKLIREAGELAEAVNAPLHVLTVVSQTEFENDADVLDTIEEVEGADYTLSPAEYAAEIAQTAVSDLLNDLEIETKPIGRSVQDKDESADEIIDVATNHDCDYVFIVGRRRSPTGKAIFGDIAQKVILNFDGYVVTLTEG